MTSNRIKSGRSAFQAYYSDGKKSKTWSLKIVGATCCNRSDKTFIIGGAAPIIPTERHVNANKGSGHTNAIERFNCTLRQRVSRLVHKTLSFAKKLTNHIGAMKHLPLQSTGDS